jgi:trans-aconitate methyltransferase
VTGDTRSRHQVAAAYDHWAAPYAELFGDPARNHPWDRAAMTVLAEAVGDGVPGPVVDLGCGPGHWTVYLAAAGLDVHGVDLSADFVAHARATYPDLRFEHRSMTRTAYRWCSASSLRTTPRSAGLRVQTRSSSASVRPLSRHV